jgi:rod shape-determining protein MreD
VRVAAHVFLAYGLLLLMTVVWPAMPVGRAAPDVLALCAVYLGLTARDRIVPAVVGAMIIGYLADLLLGTPRGLLALDAGLVCVAGHLIHSRLLVRGWLFIGVFSFFSGLLSGASALAITATAGMRLAQLGSELWVIFLSALLTGLIGPPMFRLLRRVDARFARTQRERDAALEGLIP